MWCYDDPTRFDSYERAVEQQTGNQPLARMASLYRYLVKHPPKSAKDLQSRVVFDKAGTIPVFSNADAERAYYMWIIVHNPSTFKRYVHERVQHAKTQTGGGLEDSNQEFADKLFNKLISLMEEPVKWLLTEIGFDPMQDTPLGLASRAVTNLGPLLMKLIFLLKTLEEDVPITNVVLTPLLNAYNDNNPKMQAALIAAVTPIAEILTAAAGFGIAVELAAFAVTGFMTFVNVSVNISRGKFGSAFVSSMSIIPFVGPFITQNIHTLEGLYAEFIQRKEKLRRIPLVGDDLANALNVLEV
jgi:hypothetical protein